MRLNWKIFGRCKKKRCRPSPSWQTKWTITESFFWKWEGIFLRKWLYFQATPSELSNWRCPIMLILYYFCIIWFPPKNFYMAFWAMIRFFFFASISIQSFHFYCILNTSVCALVFLSHDRTFLLSQTLSQPQPPDRANLRAQCMCPWLQWMPLYPQASLVLAGEKKYCLFLGQFTAFKIPALIRLRGGDWLSCSIHSTADGIIVSVESVLHAVFSLNTFPFNLLRSDESLYSWHSDLSLRLFSNEYSLGPCSKYLVCLFFIYIFKILEH